MSLTYENVIQQIQHESGIWRETNFGHNPRYFNIDNAVENALGVAEESGELAHAILKLKQGIRGTEAEHLLEAADALGDLFMYMCGTASALGLSLSDCITQTWDEVKKRDWNQFPTDGKTH